MTHLVTAATGTVGSEVLHALLEQGAHVRAASRSPRDWPEGVEGVVADLQDREAFRKLARDVEGAFLMAGYPSEAGLLDALSADAHVVLLSSSAAGSQDLDNAMTRYHVESERAVEASGRPWTMLRPNAFMANALRWKDQLAAGDVVRHQFPDIAIAMVDPADLGAVAAVALLKDGHAGKRYRLSGPEALLPEQQVAILGTALGRDLRFEGLDDDVARVEMGKSAPPEYVDAFFAYYRGGVVDETTIRPTVQQVLGRPARTFAAWAQRHAAEFDD